MACLGVEAIRIEGTAAQLTYGIYGAFGRPARRCWPPAAVQGGLPPSPPGAQASGTPVETSARSSESVCLELSKTPKNHERSKLCLVKG